MELVTSVKLCYYQKSTKKDQKQKYVFTDAQPAVKTIIHIKYSPGLVRCNQKTVFKE